MNERERFIAGMTQHTLRQGYIDRQTKRLVIAQRKFGDDEVRKIMNKNVRMGEPIILGTPSEEPEP